MSDMIPDAALAEMNRWATIAEGARTRMGGAKFGVILATYDAKTNTIATAAEVKATGLLPKSTAERYAQYAAAVAQALGFAPEPNAANADRLAVFVSLAGAAANVPAAHRNGILARLAEHADNLADLVKRAEALVTEAKEAREPQARGARPEGNAPHSEAEDEPVEEDTFGIVLPTKPVARPLSAILGELYAHLSGLSGDDFAEALDEVSGLVVQVQAERELADA